MNEFDMVYGNAYRHVPDLVLNAGVGEHQLAFTRHHNSRFVPGARLLGQGGHWRHSYQWEASYSSQYIVYEPSGRRHMFHRSGDWPPEAGELSHGTNLFNAAFHQTSPTNFVLITQLAWRYSFGTDEENNFTFLV